MVFVHAEEETMENKECYTELSKDENYKSLLLERKWILKQRIQR